MSKNKKDYALVTLVGTVIFSDFSRYDDNKKEIHNYFIQVKETYKDNEGNERERKHSLRLHSLV